MDSLEKELFGSDTESLDSRSDHGHDRHEDDLDLDDLVDTNLESEDPLFQSIMESTDDHDASFIASELLPQHTPHPHISGLCLHTHVLSHEDQSRLMQAIIAKNFFKGGEQNQAMCFGLRDLAWLDWLEALLKTSGTLSEPFCQRDWTAREPLFDQSIMNLYHPGNGIKPHVDLARFEDGIIIVSLLNAITMDFYPALHTMTATDPVDGGTNPYTQTSTTHREPAYSVRLEPGSIITMQGPARYEWEHGIQETTRDLVRDEWINRKIRVSITLRKMRPQAWEVGPATQNGVADRT
ncbi:hypothetical protein CPC16_000871 [Podila verticillata]|nr:hypothetical protein BGZ52_006349 [Haplosporangium bisporale]KAF9393887.1 hypothetical protein CPC16_000871 [Podila verticillata]KAI9242203.1 MAG: hypothetical protein BYD32DRAFT_271144 [Podila humilis]